MKTLQHEGFLRGPGLLQLETIQKYFDIIKEEPKFKARKKKVTDFCPDGKATSHDSSRKLHWPIVILHGFMKSGSEIVHAGVLKGYMKKNSNLKLTIRNSLSGQKVFGDETVSDDEIESGQLEIEGKITKKYNQWNLGNENCYYFEFL